MSTRKKPSSVGQILNLNENDRFQQLFYKPHMISALLVMLAYFLYVAVYELKDGNNNEFSVLGIKISGTNDALGDAKVGMLGVSLVFITIAVLMFPPGPFVRPHPIFWRVVTAFSAWYLLLLTFVLFQPKHQARQLLQDWWDPTLGHPLGERSYAADCDITSSWAQFKRNFMPQLDVFVVAHVLGWVCKGLMLRDYFIGWLLSVAFELLEYTFQNQLPNFAECWWDHWILDVLVCNWLGLYVGMRACQYFEIKTYEWRSATKSKVGRVVNQFAPYEWTHFEWGYTTSIKNFGTIIAVCVVLLQAELNAFYLKYLLWIPAEHPLNTYRLALYFFAGNQAIKEVYIYLTDPTCKKLGPNAWLVIASTMTESLICLKFSRGEGFQMIPWQWRLFWLLVLVGLIIYAAYKFIIFRPRIDTDLMLQSAESLLPDELQQQLSSSIAKTPTKSSATSTIMNGPTPKLTSKDRLNSRSKVRSNSTARRNNRKQQSSNDDSS